MEECKEIRAYDYGKAVIVSTKEENTLLGVINPVGMFIRYSDAEITEAQRKEIDILVIETNVIK